MHWIINLIIIHYEIVFTNVGVLKQYTPPKYIYIYMEEQKSDLGPTKYVPRVIHTAVGAFVE